MSLSSAKRCDMCTRLYSGFGETCADCRRAGSAEGAAQQCAECAGHFWGFGTLCAECDKCLVEGWLNFSHNGLTVPGFCRLFPTHLDAWESFDEVDAERPVATLQLAEVLSWRAIKPSGPADQPDLGFVLNFGVHKKFAYVPDGDKQAHDEWLSALRKLPIRCASPDREGGAGSRKNSAALPDSTIGEALLASELRKTSGSCCGAARVPRKSLQQSRSSIRRSVDASELPDAPAQSEDLDASAGPTLPPESECSHADTNAILHAGWLLFEHEGSLLRGYCQLHRDSLRTWRRLEDAHEGAAPEGVIRISDVLAWRPLSPADSRPRAVQGEGPAEGVVLIFGDESKKVWFDCTDSAAKWVTALQVSLVRPTEVRPSSAPPANGKRNPQIFHQNPRHGRGKREKNAYLRPTAAETSRRRSNQEAYSRSLESMLRNPVFMENVERLDFDAKKLQKTADGRAQLVGLVSHMRVRLKEAAWCARGVDWVSLFHAEDKDRSGKIDWDEFRRMCRLRLRLNERKAPDHYLRAVFQSLDDDHSGEVELEELLGFVADPVGRMLQRLRRAARTMPDWSDFVAKQDRDGSGLLEWAEFVEMCRKSFNSLDDEAQLAMVFHALDTDGSGQISFDELIALVREDEELQTE